LTSLSKYFRQAAFYIENIVNFLSCLNEEVNCTEPSIQFVLSG
jgi:hypothetical protein